MYFCVAGLAISTLLHWCSFSNFISSWVGVISGAITILQCLSIWKTLSIADTSEAGERQNLSEPQNHATAGVLTSHAGVPAPDMQYASPSQLGMVLTLPANFVRHIYP